MSPSGIRQSLILSILTKIGLPLLLGLIAIVSSHLSGVTASGAVELGVLIAFGILLILFFIDYEVRLFELDRQLSAGFRKIDRSAELFEQVERSVLDTTLLTDFLESASAADANVSPLLQRLARREIARVTWFVRQLPVGSEIAYDGEDREWLLGLTQEAQRSIDAISLSTVDAGMRGFDSGLWTSDLGTRYLELQREAVDRHVSIRRIFVFENADLARDESFFKITQLQREVGVDVRMLDYQLIPEWLRSMIFDYIIFDGAVSYEMTPATAFNAGRTRPAIVRTLLAPMPNRVRDLKNKFEQLWAAADPERQIDQ
ncbi:MAG TPA: hypothetical protein VFQ44_01025 [Streptosporangiaceae bacterium]|nr:hypothetical protein [Streptosporangiaceae bacterium]